jgi:hypothetical protein
MDTFSLIIDSLRKNDPVEARKQVRALMRSGALAEEHWSAVYVTLRLTTTAIDGRGHHMPADTKKAWKSHYTAQALEELRIHLGLEEFTPLPIDSHLEEKDAFSLIIGSLLKNDPDQAREQIGDLLRSGNLSDENRPVVNETLSLITKAINGRGDYMYADTKKAWWNYYTAQALDGLRTRLGMNEVVQFPMGATEAADQAA